MLETDPIQSAARSLHSVVAEVLAGGDPNRLRGPYCALMRAMGQGKRAREIEALPQVPWVRP